MTGRIQWEGTDMGEGGELLVACPCIDGIGPELLQKRGGGGQS